MWLWRDGGMPSINQSGAALRRINEQINETAHSIDRNEQKKVEEPSK